ncbi:MAG: hypothetical protein R3F56_13160 [Planctomycetota bacterium]
MAAAPMTVALLGLGLANGCGEQAPESVAAVAPLAVDVQQLAAAVKQNLGRGTLVNVWATW